MMYVQPPAIQAAVSEIPGFLGKYASIPFRCTCGCAFAACNQELSRGVSYPKPVPEDLGDVLDYGEDVQLLSALRAWPAMNCFDRLDNVSQMESDVYLVLRAAITKGGLHDLWPDYGLAQPGAEGEAFPLSSVDLLSMFPHIGNQEGNSEGGQSDKDIMAALASRCPLPSAELIVSIALRDRLKNNAFFPRPLHFAVMHNSFPAVKMILSYLSTMESQLGRSSYMKDSLQYPFDCNWGEFSPLLFGILFANYEVVSALKEVGSHLNVRDYEVACTLQQHGLLGQVCDQMCKLGLTADMLVLRQTVLSNNRCRITRTDGLWLQRARTCVALKDFQEPYDEAERCERECVERRSRQDVQP
eukprot:TRINITY_DN49804_c0_g1_i1.p1 TRINITY_DN49804_c0_g1~~TRINITY_DN49804_c0_g1_i1.p1  ORF type:complete len:358 (-),score=41.25 TRINITY_DN49804_c0_g1_i1:141-1214(-)